MIIFPTFAYHNSFNQTKMKQFLLYSLLSLSVFSLFGQIPTPSPTINFMYNGMQRSYSIYVPAIYNATKPTPLVLNLHGYTSNNQQQEFYGDFRPIADTANFIIVHPNGTFDTQSNQYWNVGFFPSTIDDVGFLTTLIDSISNNYNIDSDRIYSTGMSNGGFMSYKLACETPRFAAVASVTGGFTNAMKNTCSPSKATPVMEIHGTADGTVPYTGSAINLHVDSVVAYWVAFNNCITTATTTNIPNTNTTDGATAVHNMYAGGTNGATVEFFKIIGGGHTWPGAAFNTGVTCMDFSASKEIWRFFSQNKLTSGIEKADIFSQNVSLFPNPASDILTVEAKKGKLQKVEILNLLGQTLLTQTANEIPVSTLENGIYLIKLTIDNQIFTNKWVKN